MAEAGGAVGLVVGELEMIVAVSVAGAVLIGAGVSVAVDGGVLVGMAAEGSGVLASDGVSAAVVLVATAGGTGA